MDCQSIQTGALLVQFVLDADADSGRPFRSTSAAATDRLHSDATSTSNVTPASTCHPDGDLIQNGRHRDPTVPLIGPISGPMDEAIPFGRPTHADR